MKKLIRRISAFLSVAIIAMVLVRCTSISVPRTETEDILDSQNTVIQYSDHQDGNTTKAGSPTIAVVVSDEDCYQLVKSIQESEIGQVSYITSPNCASLGDNLMYSDLVVLVGHQFSDISSYAVNNPEQKFILIDAYPDPIGQQEVFDNIYAVKFSGKEIGFYAGIIAAMETKTGKVAIINGNTSNQYNVNYQLGFKCGVNYINFMQKKNVQTVFDYLGVDGGDYTEGLDVETTGWIVATSLILDECDVLFVYSDEQGRGVYKAALENGIHTIGYETDIYSGNNMMNPSLASIDKHVNSAIHDVLETYRQDSFQGQNIQLGATTGAIAYTGTQALATETTEELNALYEMISLNIIIPADSSCQRYPTIDFERFAEYMGLSEEEVAIMMQPEG